MEKKSLNVGLKILFVIYIIAMTWIIVFKMSLPSNLHEIVGVRSLNLVPFKGTGHMNEALNNIIIFVPLGIYIGILCKKWSFRKQLIACINLSLLYEISQFIFAIGRTDITDILMNSLGGLIGIGFYMMIEKVLKKEKHIALFITICATFATIPTVGLLTLLKVLN